MAFIDLCGVVAKPIEFSGPSPAPLPPLSTLLTFRIADWRRLVAIDGPVEVDPRHEDEGATVLGCLLQHPPRKLPWLGVADLSR
jgi:hypothetical protein